MADTFNALVKCNGPLHKELASYEERLKTFQKLMWPVGLKQKPNMLAEAGFFYTGASDMVTCFYCNGGLQNWELCDTPFEEHAKYYPDCGFLNITMSPQYVKRFHNGKTNNNLAMHIVNQFKSVSDTIGKNNTRVSVSQDGEYHPEKNGSKSLWRIVLDKILRRKPENNELCKICQENCLEIVFLPCSHLIGCSDCSVHLTKCPICRDHVKYFLRIFM